MFHWRLAQDCQCCAILKVVSSLHHVLVRFACQSFSHDCFLSYLFSVTSLSLVNFFWLEPEVLPANLLDGLECLAVLPIRLQTHLVEARSDPDVRTSRSVLLAAVSTTTFQNRVFTNGVTYLKVCSKQLREAHYVNTLWKVTSALNLHFAYFSRYNIEKVARGVMKCDTERGDSWHGRWNVTREMKREGQKEKKDRTRESCKRNESECFVYVHLQPTVILRVVWATEKCWAPRDGELCLRRAKLWWRLVAILTCKSLLCYSIGAKK